MIAYMLQIYFDFSGYSDMAIGLGRMFGFHFKENFNYPYSATSIQNFWRRWHISLSSWFKDYVYIPLGGNRKGKGRTVLNKLIVFFLTGLWHGASWTFVLWGLYHGFFLLLEELFFKVERWPRIVRHVYTLLVVGIGFIFFRAETLAQGFEAVSYTHLDVYKRQVSGGRSLGRRRSCGDCGHRSCRPRRSALEQKTSDPGKSRRRDDRHERQSTTW